MAARGSGGELFLVRWGAGEEGAAKAAGLSIRLYVNSRRADMFVRASSKLIRCESVSIQQPLRFDRYCDLLVADVPEMENWS